MKFRDFGFCAIRPAKGSAYSAYAPLNCSFVAPYTSSPGLSPETSAPIASTTPDRSEPRMTGKGWSSTLPSRMRASQGPTPAAFTRTRSCPAAGSDLGRSSIVIALGGPKRRTLAAYICPPLNAFKFDRRDLQGCLSHQHNRDGLLRSRPSRSQASVAASHDATIYRQNRSRDPATLIRRQEEDGFGNVGWLPISA
jgi:hypothetical protein